MDAKDIVLAIPENEQMEFATAYFRSGMSNYSNIKFSSNKGSIKRQVTITDMDQVGAELVTRALQDGALEQWKKNVANVPEE
jgi:hypothetical protein